MERCFSENVHGKSKEIARMDEERSLRTFINMSLKWTDASAERTQDAIVKQYWDNHLRLSIFKIDSHQLDYNIKRKKNAIRNQYPTYCY